MNKKREKMNANPVGAESISSRQISKPNTNIVGADGPVYPYFKENAKNNSSNAYSNPNAKFQIITYNAGGITLIALIITIIVMLILVGVTVNVAINGGLFSTAKQAVEDTQLEADRESLFSAVIGAIGNNAEVDFTELDKNLPNGFTGTDGEYTSEAGNTFYVDKNGNITDEKKTEGEDSKGNWTLSEKGDTVTNGEITLSIGDYVNYTPDQSTYEKSKLSEDYTGSTNNKTDLTTETDLKWRVLGVDGEGNLTLISDWHTRSGVELCGAKGYNNGVYILNDVCKTLYSCSELGVEARSLTIEDIESGLNDQGIASINDDEYQKNKGNEAYLSSRLYEESNYFPVLYGEETSSAIQGSVPWKGGVTRSDSFYGPDLLVSKPDKLEERRADGGLLCWQTGYYLNVDNTGVFKSYAFNELIGFYEDDDYAIASRAVCLDDEEALFGLFGWSCGEIFGQMAFKSTGEFYCNNIWRYS